MKALVKTKPEPGIELQDIPAPKMGPNDVLIKIKKTSFCGTDAHIYNWDEWASEHIKLPLVMRIFFDVCNFQHKANTSFVIVIYVARTLNGIFGNDFFSRIKMQA